MFCEKCGKEIPENEKCSCCDENISAQQPPKPKKKKTLIIIIAVVCGLLLIGGIAGAILLGSILKDSGSDDEIIDIVRNGYFEELPEPTVGEAFEEFFDDPEWTSFTTNEGETAVEFNGVCALDGEDADCCIQFKVFEDGSFETQYVEIDGEALTDEDVIVMYETIYGYSMIVEESIEGITGNTPIETPTKTPSESQTEETVTQPIVSQKTFNMTFNDFMSKYNNSLSADSLESYFGSSTNDKSKLESFGNDYKIMGEDITFNEEKSYYLIPIDLFYIRVSVTGNDLVEECAVLCPVTVSDDGLTEFLVFCGLMVHGFEPNQNFSYCNSVASNAVKDKVTAKNGIEYSMSEDSSYGYFKISPAE